MKRYIYIFILTLLTSACAEKISSPSEHVDYGSEREDYVTRLDDGMMVLGEKLNNPYSLSNMQAAYDELCKTKSLSSEKLEATDLYVRFLPKDSTDIAFLQNLDLEFFDFPLDYEIEEYGNYYHDPSVPEGEITWQYTKVKPDFVFPDIQYEIIDECYIPEEDEELTKSSICGGDFAEELEMLAIKMADLPAEYSVSEDYIETKAKVKKYPSGSVLIYKEDNDTIPAKGVKIRCHYFLKWDSDFTDDEGNYNISKKFSCNPTYAIILDNVKGFKVWGNYGFLGAANHNVGRQNKSGYNFEIYNNSQAWKWLVINNAAYDYYNDCILEGVLLPHNEIRIWSAKSDKTSWGAATMLRRIGGVGLDINSVAANALSNIIIIPATTLLMTVFKFALPDIIVVSREGVSTFESIYSMTYHELCHASHCKKVGATYWSRYASYIMSHGFEYGDYGGDKDSGICEVGEAWAYAVERIKYRERFGTNKEFGKEEWFNESIDVIQSLMDDLHLNRSVVFDNFTTDVKTMDRLYENIIKSVDSSVENQVEYLFASHGVLDVQTHFIINNMTSKSIYVNRKHLGRQQYNTIYKQRSLMISAFNGDTEFTPSVLEDFELRYGSELFYSNKEGIDINSMLIDISESSNWKKKIMTSNGKNIIVWTLELRDDDFYE